MSDTGDTARTGDVARTALSRDRIIGVAVEYADANGVEQLTMRSVAEALGCAPMSLYNHVANKSDLLAAMVDVVAAEIDLAPETADGDWRDAMRAISEAAHHVLRRHPWVVTEWTVQMPGPARIDFMEAILRILTEAGLSEELVYHGYHAVTMHIVGFTQQELGYERLGADVVESVAMTFMQNLGGDYPHMAAHVRAHFSGADHGDEFLFVLDLILDGLANAG